MSRNAEIEAIHEARFDLETCAPREAAAARQKLERLVSKAISRSGSNTSVKDLLDALYDDYKELRRGKRQQQWPRV
jgi:hypothetical protein